MTSSTRSTNRKHGALRRISLPSLARLQSHFVTATSTGRCIQVLWLFCQSRRFFSLRSPPIYGANNENLGLEWRHASCAKLARRPVGNRRRGPARDGERDRKNLRAIAQIEKDFLEKRTLSERIGDSVGAAAGSVPFVLIHLAWFGAWLGLNLGGVPGIQPFDKYPFSLLQLLVSLEAIFLVSFILMRQNRMSRQTDQRAHMDLQINLLAEKETTRILQLQKRMAERMGLEIEVKDNETELLSKETHLGTLVDQIEQKLPSD